MFHTTLFLWTIEKRREEKGNPQTKEEEKKSGEIGGLTVPTYPPKPHLTFSIVFLREFF